MTPKGQEIIWFDTMFLRLLGAENDNLFLSEFRSVQHFKSFPLTSHTSVRLIVTVAGVDDFSEDFRDLLSCHRLHLLGPAVTGRLGFPV